MRPEYNLLGSPQVSYLYTHAQAIAPHDCVTMEMHGAHTVMHEMYVSPT